MNKNAFSFLFITFLSILYPAFLYVCELFEEWGHYLLLTFGSPCVRNIVHYKNPPSFYIIALTFPLLYLSINGGIYNFWVVAEWYFLNYSFYQKCHIYCRAWKVLHGRFCHIISWEDWTSIVHTVDCDLLRSVS